MFCLLYECHFQQYLTKDDNIVRQMFEHLTNLGKINLHSTYISLVPEVLNTLPHLNSIILQGNKIVLGQVKFPYIW
jgi:hypothetical protein